MSIAIPQTEHGTFRLGVAGDPEIADIADTIRKNHGEITQDVDDLDLRFATQLTRACQERYPNMVSTGPMGPEGDGLLRATCLSPDTDSPCADDY
ncbi:MAG: hypothetical protein ACLP9L_22165 [Thermoguttaceae bacterium]